MTPILIANSWFAWLNPNRLVLESAILISAAGGIGMARAVFYLSMAVLAVFISGNLIPHVVFRTINETDSRMP